MLPPSTAGPGRSVWDGVGRKTFEERIDALHRTRFVPESRVLLERDWPKQRSKDVLPFATEKQLCDDLSFIAACEYGVGHVTAATAETVRSDPGGLTLRLAANEGVGNCIVEEIEKILRILERCAQKRLPRDQCTDEVFDVVVKLNINRILGRLASKLFQRPSYERGPRRNPLTIRLKEYIASHKPSQLSSESPGFGILCAQADALHASFLQIESSPAGGILIATKSVVKDAFSLTEDGFSLPSRLGKMGFATSVIDTRDIREINKIANYWRICRSLAQLSRCYRTLFAKLRLEVLEPYEPSQTIDKKLNKFVHAEVQMVVFYETSISSSWPRAIGVSKEACFLCDSFIKAHGHFYLSKAHRQIFPQWTIPDRKEYSTETLRRLKTSLATVAKSITVELEKARRHRGFQPFPLQSSINLHKPPLPTPSVTTTRSSGSETVRAASPVRQPITTEPAVLGSALKSRDSCAVVADGVKSNVDTCGALSIDTLPLRPPESESVLEAATPDLSTGEGEVPSTTAGSLLLTRAGPCTTAINFTSTEHHNLDWVSLYVDLECASLIEDRNHVSPAGFGRASIVLESVDSYDAIRGNQDIECIDIATLPSGTEKTIITPVGNDERDYLDHEVEFVLTNRRRKPVRVKCRWHRV